MAELSGGSAPLNPLVRRLLHTYWRFARGLTVGVRAVVLRNDEVFLVRHTYVRGWHLPGGGVEVGETVYEALARELAEEGNIVLNARPALHAIYFNRQVSRRDHVALFVVRDFTQSSPRSGDREIAETGFFPFKALPEGATQATWRRLAEVTGGAPVSPDW
jgi:ADP-ribose pyrophosphatase YjhB (NUDIX family)